MKNIKSYYFLLILTLLSSHANPMKRSFDDIAPAPRSSAQKPVADTHTIDLPDEIMLKIFSQVPRTTVIQICKNLYNIFCFRNHLTNDPAKVDNWKWLCEQHPELITAHPVECQRAYYLLLQENNVDLMRRLLKTDSEIDNNIHEVVCHLRNTLENIVKSPAMLECIYEYTKSRNKNGNWCPREDECGSSIGYTMCAACGLGQHDKPLDTEQAQFIDLIMNNNTNGIVAFIRTMDPEENQLLLGDGFLCNDAIAYYTSCADIWNALLPLFKRQDELDIDEYEGQSFDELFARAVIHGNLALTSWCLENGADPDHGNTMGKWPMKYAIKRIIKKNNYDIFNILCKHGAQLSPKVTKRRFDTFQTVSRDLAIPDDQYEAFAQKYGVQTIDTVIGGRISVLLYAVLIQNQVLVQTLLDNGANPYGPQSADSPKYSLNTDLLEIATTLGNQEIINAIQAARTAHSESDGDSDNSNENLDALADNLLATAQADFDDFDSVFK